MGQRIASNGGDFGYQVDTSEKLARPERFERPTLRFVETCRWKNLKNPETTKYLIYNDL